ncbi:MAG: EAL domain-containing protein [Bryobacteraceae bacterium]|nr:EAL domain-containing protein [Bryobacteraceae bacterium]
MPFREHPTEEALVQCRLDHWLDSESWSHNVTEMIVQQRPLGEVMEALCRHCGRRASERQVAFYLLDGHEWAPAARGNLTAEGEEALAAVDPAALSDAVLAWNGLADDRLGYPFEGGWARHLMSGIGELLGLFVSLADGPFAPFGIHAARIHSVCRFAALAIEQKNLLDELVFKANHDALTGLFNRNYQERVLEWTLSQERNQAGRRAALLSVNLDRFRLVNDVLGHSIGDRLLAEVGRRLGSGLEGRAMLARPGGDEFTILLPHVESAAEAGEVADRLLGLLAEPFRVGGHQLFVTASIGIGCSGAGSTVTSLERAAYVALYHAKRGGKARWMHFDPSMAATPPERLEMEKQLHFALERKEMLLYYQPQVELATGVVAGAEVLMRWRPEGLGIVAPGAFIPIMEETGLIIEFGRWALGEACRQGMEWAARGGGPLRLAVNVSAIQFAHPSFLRDVEQALASTGFPPECLELELTESLFIGDLAGAARVFRALQSTGVAFALDDFGTGQSALAYLQRLPFQRLKIDQSFVRPIGDADRCPPLVENIVRMAESLGMAAIAEGVETERQATLLRLARCAEGQGYYYSPPLPADDFAAYRAGRTRAGQET